MERSTSATHSKHVSFDFSLNSLIFAEGKLNGLQENPSENLSGSLENTEKECKKLQQESSPSSQIEELSLNLSEKEDADLATNIGSLSLRKKLGDFLRIINKSCLSRLEKKNDDQFKLAMNTLVHSAKYDLPNTIPLLQRIEPQQYQRIVVNKIALAFVEENQLKKVVEVAKCLPINQRETVIRAAGFALTGKEHFAASSFIITLAKTDLFVALQFTDQCVLKEEDKPPIIHKIAYNLTKRCLNPIASIIKELLKQNVSVKEAEVFLKYASAELDKKAANAHLQNSS